MLAFVFQTNVGIDKSNGRRSPFWAMRGAQMRSEWGFIAWRISSVLGENQISEMHLYFESRPVPFLEEYGKLKEPWVFRP